MREVPVQDETAQGGCPGGGASDPHERVAPPAVRDRGVQAEGPQDAHRVVWEFHYVTFTVNSETRDWYPPARLICWSDHTVEFVQGEHFWSGRHGRWHLRVEQHENHMVDIMEVQFHWKGNLRAMKQHSFRCRDRHGEIWTTLPRDTIAVSPVCLCCVGANSTHEDHI